MTMQDRLVYTMMHPDNASFDEMQGAMAYCIAAGLTSLGVSPDEIYHRAERALAFFIKKAFEAVVYEINSDR